MHVLLAESQMRPLVQMFAEGLYTTGDAAAYVGVSPHCIRYYVKAGYISRYGRPGRSLFWKDELDAMRDHPRSKPWLRTHQPNRKFKRQQNAALAKIGAEQGEPKGKKRERVR